MTKPDVKKGTDFIKSALNKTSEASKKAVETVKIKSQELSDQAQMMLTNAQIKKYSPLFSEELLSNDFILPKLIQIVDENVRQGIAVCEGSIGWTSGEKDTAVLHIYNTATELVKVEFLPFVQCDSIYYVDPHNSNVYINIDTYFSNIQHEKLAELQHIAYSLGAKRYWVEVVDDKSESSLLKKGTTFKAKAKVDISTEEKSTSASSSKSVVEASFSDAREPTMPNLCWFSNDKNLQNVIKMRCEDKNNSITEYTLELSSSSAMSSSTAAKIDSTVSKFGISCNFNKNVHEERNQKMFFKLEF
ncbi:MAG: hypothetical protein ACI3XF_06420 [Eubacteriales bacterium]